MRRFVGEHQFIETVLLVESDFGFLLELGFLNGLEEFLERLLILEVGLFLEFTYRGQIDELRQRVQDIVSAPVEESLKLWKAQSG